MIQNQNTMIQNQNTMLQNQNTLLEEMKNSNKNQSNLIFLLAKKFFPDDKDIQEKFFPKSNNPNNKK